MTPLLFGLIGLAAVLHATWNALLKGSADPLRLAARALGVTTLVGVPPAVVIWVAVARGPPLRYGWVRWGFAAVLLNAWVFGRGFRGGWEAPKWSQALAVGVPMTAAYLLVLLALNVAPLSVVSPVRESAIVLVTGWGIWRLRERRGASLRLAGAAAIVLGSRCWL